MGGYEAGRGSSCGQAIGRQVTRPQRYAIVALVLFLAALLAYATARDDPWGSLLYEGSRMTEPTLSDMAGP